VDLIATLQREHPRLAWDAFAANWESLMAPLQPSGSSFIAEDSPEIFWNSLPVDQLESWVRAHVPAQMHMEIAHGMEAARLRLGLQARLSAAVSQFAAAQASQP
jgi:hypothetical protein